MTPATVQPMTPDAFSRIVISIIVSQPCLGTKTENLPVPKKPFCCPIVLGGRNQDESSSVPSVRNPPGAHKYLRTPGFQVNGGADGT